MRWEKKPCDSETILGSRVGGRLVLGDARDRFPDNLLGAIQCIYIDPPFNTGDQFRMRMRVGDAGWSLNKPAIALNTYGDRYPSVSAYIDFLRPVLQNAYDALNETGSLFLHLDSRVNAYARVELDRIFGEKNFINEIIWAYQSGGRSVRFFSRKHDTIYFYAKNAAKLFFDIKQAPMKRADNRSNHMRRCVDEQGRTYRTIRSGGKIYTYYDDEPVYPSDVWSDVSHLQQKDPQRTGYDTQKPSALLQRILCCATRPGDLVCDLFCGSGTTLTVAAENGRRFYGVDSAPAAIGVSRKRLLHTQLTLTARCSGAIASIEASLHSGLGYYQISLKSVRLSDEALKDPALQGISLGVLDAVDQWSVGFLEGGVFQTHKSDIRSKMTPRLTRMLELPMLRGTPAILICDILGGRSVWQISREDFGTLIQETAHGAATKEEHA